MLGDLPSSLEAHHLLTLVSFEPWMSTIFVVLLHTLGLLMLPLLMPFHGKMLSGSSDSDCFWFYITMGSVSHQNKLRNLNVNFFTGKVRSPLVSRKVLGRMKWREQIYVLSIHTSLWSWCMEVLTIEIPTPHTKVHVWSNKDYAFVCVIVCEWRTVVFSCLQSPKSSARSYPFACFLAFCSFPFHPC